jgi:type VI secretion system protein ImpA
METPPVPPVIDVDALLAPIDGDAGAGADLRYEGTYDRIREARRADEPLAQGDWKRDLKTAEWQKVIDLATVALTKKTKDLQISAWLAEALISSDRLDRLAGLRDGLRLLTGLHTQYWENVYPEMDPEDDEGPLAGRANILESMGGSLARELKNVPLTHSTIGVDYCFAQWEDSKQFDVPENLASLSSSQVEKAEETKARAAAEHKITSEDWRKAKNTSTRAFYESRVLVLGECAVEVKALDQVMDEKFQRQTPGLKALEKSLDDVRTLVDNLVKEKRLLEPDPEELAAQSEGQEEPGAAPAQGGAVARTTGGAIDSRRDALRQLAQVADFFRRTEPHSPVSYLVQRAVRWGEMPLEVWLNEVIKDSSVLTDRRETLGIKSESE